MPTLYSTMKRLCSNWWLIGGLLLLISCKKDDYHYPDVVTDLVDTETNAAQQLERIRTDAGEELQLVEPMLFEKSTPDSTYRIRCRYQLLEGQKVKLYAAAAILAPEPQDSAYFKGEFRHDPVKVTSVWKSGHYLNLHLGIMTKLDKKHGLNFLKQKHQKTVDGKQVWHVQLYHDQGGDPEAFTRETFMSCPLQSLKLAVGDSIYLHIHTYDGLKTFGFVQ